MARVDASDVGIGAAIAAFAAYGLWRGWSVGEPLVAALAAVVLGIIVAELVERHRGRAPVTAEGAPAELQDPVPKLVDAILLLAIRKGARHVALREQDGALSVLHQCGTQWTEQLRPPAHLRAAIVDELKRRARQSDGGFTVVVRDRAVRVDVGFTVEGDLVHLVVDPAPPN